MRLIIVTINYNSSGNTIQLLESLKNQSDKDFEVIVVDNNSDDVKILTDYKTPETNITFLKNNRNLGFSGGNNVAIKKALERDANWLLLLNNDTMPPNDLIFRLKAYLEDKDGIVGITLDEGHGRLAYAGEIKWLKPTLAHTTNKPVEPSGNYYAIGGAILIHKDVFKQIGFLEEKYFLYFEDADFCQRAKKSGIPINFFSDVQISHSVSVSTKKLGSPTLLRYHYRNALYFNFKNGPWYIKLLVWPWSWWIIFKQITKMILKINTEESSAILKGVFDWYTGKMGKIKLA